MMRILISLAAFIITCAPGVANAATVFEVIIGHDGNAVVNDRPVTDVLSLEGKRETILLILIPEAAEPANRVTVQLQVPVTMVAEWRPRLIPSRCACQTTTKRLSDKTFELTANGLTTGGRISLEAEFPRGTFDLSASQKAALGVERASPWLIALAGLILLGGLGMLGWMMVELHNMRKFRLTPNPEAGPPNDLSAAVVSLIPSGKITPATMGAMLIELAERGYLTISKQGQHFSFIQTKPLDLTGPGFALGSFPGDTTDQAEIMKARREGLTMAEKYLLAKIFTKDIHQVSDAQFKARLGDHLSSWKLGKVYAELYKQVGESGFFIRNPHLIHLHYRGIGIVIFFLGLAGFASTAFVPAGKLALYLMWGLVTLTGYIITRMVPFLPLLTVLGQAEWARWGGFRLFLSNPAILGGKLAPAKFFDYLPYALAFGAMDAWGEHFAQESVAAPSWYQSEPVKKPVPTYAKEIGELADYVGKLLARVHEHTVQ